MLLNFSACLCDSLSLSVSVCASVCLLVCRNFHFVARVPHPGHLALSSLYLPRRCLSYFCVTLEFPCPTRTSFAFAFAFSFYICFFFSSVFFLSFLLDALCWAQQLIFNRACALALWFFYPHAARISMPLPFAVWAARIFPFFRSLCFFACYFHK